MDVVENAPWGCYEQPDRVHVAPMMDILEHELTADCVCGPRQEMVEPGSWMFTHHSLDGREFTAEVDPEARP